MSTIPPVKTNTSLTSGPFLTGALVGGAVTYVLANENVQRAVINSAAMIWMAVKGGVEETREKFRDAESEIRATRAE